MEYKELAVAIAVPLCGGLLSGLLGSRPDIRSWYQYLRKPKWAPAPWVFGPVWSVLVRDYCAIGSHVFEYITMGTASYLVYKAGGAHSQRALIFYVRVRFYFYTDIAPGLSPTVELCMVAISPFLASLARTPTFFRAKRMDIALVDLSLVWLSVAGCIGLFFPSSWIASALMLPYLSWCTLAWALNYSVWQLNRTKSD